MKGGRKSSGGGEEGGEKKCFALLQSKQAEEGAVFVRLRRVAAVTDVCRCENDVYGCECSCARALSRGAHPSALPGDYGGRGRKGLVTRKKKSSPPY